MTLQDIDAFLAVVAYGTYSRAAEALYTTAPTIAYHLRQLEHELGFALVEKAGRYVVATPAAKELYGRLREVRSALDCAVADARDIAVHRKSTLHLGVMRLMPHSALSAILKDFYKGSPDDRVVLHEYEQTSYFDDFAQKRTDAICVYGSNRELLPPQARYLPLWDARVGVAVAADHPLASHASVSLDELRGETVVLPDLGDGYRDPAIAPRIQSLIDGTPILYSQSHEDAFHHVRIGRGVLVTPYATGCRDETVAFVPLEEFEPTGAGIAYRADESEPVVLRFLESARRAASTA